MAAFFFSVLQWICGQPPHWVFHSRRGLPKEPPTLEGLGFRVELGTEDLKLMPGNVPCCSAVAVVETAPVLKYIYLVEHKP